MTILVEGNPHAASRFLNYQSLTLSSATSPGLLGRRMGPNTLGEVLTVVSVQRALSDTGEPCGTRLGFCYGTPPANLLGEAS